MALLIFLLHFGLIKFRFHYFKHQILDFYVLLISGVLEPRTYGFYYSKIPQTILESIWDHLGKYYLWKYETQNFQTKSDHVCTQLLNY